MKVQVDANTAMADVLETAAEHIRAGWTQGRPFEHVNGQRYVCANGALWLAAGLPETTSEGFPVAGAAPFHRALLPSPHLALWATTRNALNDYVGQESSGWNDAIGQTQAVVADTMLRLAKELRPVEQT